jgi:uncharacterized protein involved in tolerance to divalent cations
MRHKMPHDELDESMSLSQAILRISFVGCVTKFTPVAHTYRWS